MSGQPYTSYVEATPPKDSDKCKGWRFWKDCDEDPEARELRKQREKEWEKECEEKCERKCKPACKRVCCVLPLLIIGGLVAGVFAIARGRYQSSFPDACFVDHHYHHRHNDDVLTSELRTEVLDAAAIASLCETQLTAMCGADAPLPASNLAAALSWQACVSERFYQLDTECRGALTEARLFDQALFPDALRDEDKLEDTADKCKDDVQEHCERSARFFDDDNLCQVYEIGLCLQALPVDKISAECRAAIAEYGLVAPQDYDVETFSLQIPEARRHGIGFWGGFLIFLASVLTLKSVCKCCKAGRDRRRAKERAAQVQADKLSGVTQDAKLEV